MNIFAGCHGRVFVINNGNNQKGFYSFDPELKSSEDSPILLTWADLNDNDIVLPQVTLSNTKLLYVFGQQFGRVNVAGSLLLGTQDKGNAAALKSLLQWFVTNRSSTKREPVTLSMPGKNVLKVHIVGLSLGQVDSDMHIQQFAIAGLVAELPNASGGKGAAGGGGGGAGDGGAGGDGTGGGLPAGDTSPDYSALPASDSPTSPFDGALV